MRRMLLFFMSLATIGTHAHAGDFQSPKREFRGAWIATVVNLDWPNSRIDSPANQRQQLVTMLDKLHEAGINAVMFQIRTECDALYDSPYEPWSYWLTGEQGKAPDPFYDPLEFAVEEAHKRGMEIHAWFNPYRAERSVGSYDLADNHVVVRNPEWAIQISSFKFLDPGLPEVREYVSGIVADVVRRYDIDGVHFDDYFYPYPPNQINNEDDATFAEHSRGFTDIGDWRRDNVNLLIEAVHDSINAIKPHVKFGISPFGIWKNGVPAGIVGLDAYNVIFADATAWMEAETIDYIVPQLYWPFGGGQDYGKLAPWWESVRNGRQYYPGHGLYRSDSNTFSGTLFAANEIPRQVRFNREHDGIDGSVFFRAKNITLFHSRGFADSLKNDLYRHPSIIPSVAWKDSLYAPIDPPDDFVYSWLTDQTLLFEWQAPPLPEFGDDLIRYAVYRINSASPPVFPEDLAHGEHVLSVQADRWLEDSPLPSDDPYYYVVTALNRNHNESEPSEVIVITVTSVPDDRIASTYSLQQNYPNPFNPETVIQFSIPSAQHVTLHIYDVLGRVVDVPVDTYLSAGQHRITFNAADLASGVYVYRIKAGEFIQSKRMVAIK
jgi:uncharacterized lipoprotein YddW (UPF0748 family)